MKIGVVVPARMSSSRLPGKVLIKINGKNPIQRICSAAEASGIINKNLINHWRIYQCLETKSH